MFKNQGSPQYVIFDFPELVKVEKVSIMFQGGFAGKDCALLGKREETNNFETLLHFEPEDVNSLQTFEIPEGGKEVKQVQLIFNRSSDSFGRITIYHLIFLPLLELSQQSH